MQMDTRSMEWIGLVSSNRFCILKSSSMFIADKKFLTVYVDMFPIISIYICVDRCRWSQQLISLPTKLALSFIIELATSLGLAS